MPVAKRSEGVAGVQGRAGSGRALGPAPGGIAFVLVASAIAWALILTAIFA